VTWDNSGKISVNGCRLTTQSACDLGVYGRYKALAYATHDVIFVQDDDCILANPANIVAAYEPGVVTYNMPYAFRDGGVDSVMVGFGACFDKHLPQQAFDRWFAGEGHGMDAVFKRTCDVVFTTLTPTKMIHEPIELLDYSYAENRMWQQPGHQEERRMIHDLALKA